MPYNITITSSDRLRTLRKDGFVGTGEQAIELPLIVFDGPRHATCAHELAQRLETQALPIERLSSHELSGRTYVLFDERGTSLNRDDLFLQADFSESFKRLDKRRLSGELLVHAAHLPSMAELPLAVDATAGLGNDALLLAAAGFDVHLYERNPIIAALLEDALDRASASEQCSTIAARMRLFKEDSTKALPAYNGKAAIVLLDPMFPARTKSASVKKKFQLLHQIEKPHQDDAALMNAAIAANPVRIIVKRPIKGPFFADIKPHHSIKGKAVRYDCIEPLSLPKRYKER